MPAATQGDHRGAHLSPNPQAPVIYLIDSPDHPTPLAEMEGKIRSTVMPVPIADWGTTLTPWPAPALYREEADYGGGAVATLAWLVDEKIPALEDSWHLQPRARAIAGYSLAGLFSLYAFLEDDRFAAVGCLSGSLWYDGWLGHLAALQVPTEGRYAYLSLGSKEKRASQARLKQVEERTRSCVDLLRERGLACDFVLNPGGHLTHITERMLAGISALDAFLAPKPSAIIR